MTTGRTFSFKRASIDCTYTSFWRYTRTRCPEIGMPGATTWYFRLSLRRDRIFLVTRYRRNYRHIISKSAVFLSQRSGRLANLDILSCSPTPAGYMNALGSFSRSHQSSTTNSAGRTSIRPCSPRCRKRTFFSNNVFGRLGPCRLDPQRH